MSGSLFNRKGASIILVSQFETGVNNNSKQNKELQTFVDYMSREEALKKEEQKFKISVEELEELQRIEAALSNMELETNQPIIKDVRTIDRYIDYMTRKKAIEENSNSEIVPGAFSSSKRYIHQDDIKEIKNEVINAKNNKAVMFQDVISFDNDFLEREGYYKKETGELNENVLYESTKAMMDKLKEKEELVNPFWFATIHRNTEHIHIHVSTMERKNTREMKEYDGKLQAKGLRKKSTLNEMVFSFGNKMIDRTNQFERISELRKEVPLEVKQNVKQTLINMYQESNQKNPVDQEKKISKLLSELKNEIPVKTRGYNSLPESTRSKIDEFTDVLTLDNPKRKEYESVTKEIDILYQETYGKRYEPEKFYKNRKKEFNTRTGNAVVKQIKEFKKDEIKQYNENNKEIKEEQNKESVNFKKYKFKQYNENKKIINDNQNMKNINFQELKLTVGESWKIKNELYNKRKAMYEKSINKYKLEGDLYKVKRSINDDLSMYRAERDYERVTKEIEYESQIKEREMER